MKRNTKWIAREIWKKKGKKRQQKNTSNTIQYNSDDGK